VFIDHDFHAKKTCSEITTFNWKLKIESCPNRRRLHLTSRVHNTNF